MAATVAAAVAATVAAAVAATVAPEMASSSTATTATHTHTRPGCLDPAPNSSPAHSLARKLALSQPLPPRSPTPPHPTPAYTPVATAALGPVELIINSRLATRDDLGVWIERDQKRVRRKRRFATAHKAWGPKPLGDEAIALARQVEGELATLLSQRQQM